MTLKPLFTAMFTAGLLSGCVTQGTQPQPSPSLVALPGKTVPAGVPCDRLIGGGNGVAGCEGSVAQSGVTGAQAAEIASLNTRFAADVSPVVHFDFDRAELTPAGRTILDAQAAWMRRFAHLRFSVYGHTDLVGSEGYNFGLAKRRAETVVAYLASRGVSSDQLEALVSYGETRPLIATSQREELNRRTVTEVTAYLTAPRLRTTVPVACATIAPRFLPTYPGCVIAPSRQAAPTPGTPSTRPDTIDIDTSAETGTGSTNTGTEASYSNDGTTETSSTSGFAGGGSVSSGVTTSTTGDKRSVSVSIGGKTRTYEGNRDGSNMREVTK